MGFIARIEVYCFRFVQRFKFRYYRYLMTVICGSCRLLIRKRQQKYNWKITGNYAARPVSLDAERFY
jgi:hypothetical protein